MVKTKLYPPIDRYVIRLVDDPMEFEKLKPEWDSLVEIQPGYGPFLSFRWFRIWLNNFKGSHKIFILLLYENGCIECIAPLLIKRQRFKGLRVKKMELIGNVYSPVKTFIFKEVNNKTKNEELISAIFAYIFQKNECWDVIDLDSIPMEGDTLEIFKSAISKNGVNYQEYCCFENWYSDGINYSSEQYFKRRSKNLRASMKKNYRNAGQKGKIEFKMIKNSADLERGIEGYLGVYKESWKRQENVGPEFVIDWMKEAAKTEWLRLGLVYLDSIPISCGFAVVYRGTAYLEKTAFDDKYKEIGPGSIWLSEMIKYIIDVDKVERIDFLKGNEQYKEVWASSRRERKGLVIFNENLKGYSLSVLIKHVLPLINRSDLLKKMKHFIRRS